MNRDLAHQSIAVIGYGITGRACVRFLLSQEAKVCVLDRDMNIQSKVDQELINEKNVSAAIFEPSMSLSVFPIVVISPGVNPHQLCFQQYRQQGGILIGDIELFAWFNKTPLIGITGSNGKTTVTDMLGKVLTHAGLQVELAGNYGKCAIDLLLEEASRVKPLDIVVLELSSYQLEMTESLQLEFATILNITEDHLDRHGSFEAYKLAKQRIFSMSKNIIACRDEVLSYPESHAGSNTVNSDQETLQKTKRICAEVGLKSTDTGYSISNDQKTSEAFVQFNGVSLFMLSDLQLKGAHNYINAMIVLAICDQLMLDRKLTIEAICAYQGLPHRFQTIHASNKIDGDKVSNITWINDSKATNVGACQAALACFKNSDDYLVLIAGGDAKGVDLLPLKELIDTQVKHLIVLGKDAPKFIQLVPEAIRVRDLEQAVSTALSLLQKADYENAVVLLSPACASLDMFSNYQERGDVFVNAVKEQVA